MFTVRADLSNVINDLKPISRNRGVRYFRLEYNIIILFGVTEFKAQYAWEENVCFLIILSSPYPLIDRWH